MEFFYLLLIIIITTALKPSTWNIKNGLHGIVLRVKRFEHNNLAPFSILVIVQCDKDVISTELHISWVKVPNHFVVD